jgi:tetratricopeptide (TPR) repeat protein
MANPKSPGGRLLRVEDLDTVLDHELENAQAVLDTLVNALAKNNHLPALFEKLHAVAAAQDRLADLAFAYENMVQDRRVKLLSPENQAHVFVHAVEFFADVFGDPDGAVAYAERALAAVPGQPEAVAKLRKILTDQGDAARLAKLELDLATHARDPDAQIPHLREAVSWAKQVEGLDALAIEALTKLQRLDPSDSDARAELEERLIRAGKPKEAVKVLEQALGRDPPVDAAEEFAIRTRLLDLYTNDLKEPHRALPHIEELLAAAPEHQGARQVAERLLDNRAVAARAAAALSDAYTKVGMTEQATAMLSFELKTVRGPRRLEVQRRLAFIRHDQGDPVGALELLGPVVSADPGEDEARRRFVEISLSLNQPAEAAKLLTRALGSCKDPATRARVSAEIGTVYMRSGDAKRAEAAFQQVIEDGSDPHASLTAARQLLELHDKSSDQKALAGSLEIVARLETDPERRNTSARRLAKMAEGELNDPKKAVTAWRALMDSPWADEALRKLSALYEEAGDFDGLVDVMERRSQRAKDQGEARHLMFRAAELRTTKGRDRAAALAAWRSHIARFGPAREVHAQMIPLLEQEKQWKELAWVLEREIELAPLEEWTALLARLAQLRLARLEDPAGALEAYKRALETDASDKVSRTAVDKLLGTGEPEHRLQAAAILESVYRDEAPGPGLLRVLEARSELEPEREARVLALEEAIGLADRVLRDPARALELAARGLRHAVNEDAASIPTWVGRLRGFAADAGKVPEQAKALLEALGDRMVDTPELSVLARAAAEAAVQNADLATGVAIFRRALEFEPSSAELLGRLDELLAEQGSPEDRLALYRSALGRGPTPARRREILHSMARLLAQEFGRDAEAVEIYSEALADDPKDAAAHQALVDIYTRQRSWPALYAELERALSLHEGERRNATLLKMAEVAAERGDANRALEHYRELLGSAELGDVVLENIELIAHANNDVETMRTVLERRIAVAGAPEDRAALLEKLGLVQAKQLVDADAAAKSWLAGAAAADAAGDDDRARRLYERVLGVAPDDAVAARRLIELYAAVQAWTKIPEPFAVLLRSGVDERDVVALLLSLERPAAEAGAVDVFVTLSDAVLGQGQLEPSRLKQVLLARARVLSPDLAQRDEVAALYRRVLDMGGDDAPSVAEAFNLFLAGGELTPARVGDRRWLFEWRAARAADPTTVLIAWAVAEETSFGNPAAAIELYKRVLERDPERLDALHQLARLQTSHGDAEGALDTLRALSERSDGEQQSAVELTTAGLLLERLSRPLEALGVLEKLLDATPGDAEVLRLVRAALAFDESRAQAALLLEKVAEGAETPEARAEVLESLIEISRGVPELKDAQRRWYQQLLESREDDDEASLGIALRGTTEWPEQPELWDAAERIARRLNQPEPVAEAYAKALDLDLPAEVAEEIGRRMVEFHEEWFEDADRVVRLLSRVLELCPAAGWAFDRLKLAFNAGARWNDLFALYDRAVERAGDAAERTELLREAAMAAKDFANDPERAIEYLERLDELSPGDARIESALERLYEREGRIKPLIALLSRRVDADAPVDTELTSRITSLWLDLGDAVEAFKLIEKLLANDATHADVYALIERLVALPAARESIAPGDEGKKRRKATRSVRHAAAELLRKRYESAGRVGDVARMLEVELELAEDKKDRIKGLQKIITLKLDKIGDLSGAFESTAQLVALDPAAEAHRARLADLAEQTQSQSRRAELLVGVADGSRDAATRITLVLEAADVQKALGAAAEAIELYQRALQEAEEDPDSSLRAARELDGLLEAAGRSKDRCAVLERLADLEREPAERAKALGNAARVAGQKLGDWERAIAAWRLRLADDERDAVALDGLCDALAMAEKWSDLVAALETRADNCSDPGDKKRDREGVARLWALQLGDLDKAIDAWLRLRAEFGKDKDSFEALAELYTQSQRWNELALLTATEVEEEPETERRRALSSSLAELHFANTGDLSAALGAFVSAGAWQRASDVVSSTEDRVRARLLAEKLLELAVADWTRAPEPSKSVDDGSGWAAGWALSALVTKLGEEGDHAAVAAALTRGAELPFPTERRRALRRDAALIHADRLAEVERATELLRGLFEEDPGDEIAQESVARFAGLLEEQTLHPEIVGFWEQQAKSRAEADDKPAAAALYARAADIAEQRLADVDRAIADHREAAALGGEASLEALARIFESKNDARKAAEVLEKLCALSTRDELGPRALRLAEAYLQAGKPDVARARLEQAAGEALEAGAVRRRLAELYRSEEDWAPLALLLTDEATRASDNKSRLKLLGDAARIHLEKLADPNAASPLLSQAIELAPDDPALRLLLADAMTRAGRFEEATATLRSQIERYGTRKPKGRALVHFHLARVSLAAGRRAEAIAELDLANKIDPAHPGILQTLAKLAFEEGQLERAEKQYRALLLVLGRSDDPDGPSRAEALLDLSEIAARGDDPVRAQEFVESAFEAALESEREASALERTLKDAGKHDLLARALEARLERATAPTDAARALADLAFLYAEHLGGLGESAPRIRDRARHIEQNLENAGGGDDRAWAALGRVYDWLGDADAEAIVLERRVAALLDGRGPVRDAEPLYRLAEIRLQNPELREAGLDVLERVLELAPDLGRAEALLRSAIAAGATDERTVMTFERVARASGDPKTLADALELVVALPGMHMGALREGIALAENGEDPTVARRLLERALADGAASLPHEDAAWALTRLGALCEQAGELGRALEIAEQVAALAPPGEARGLLLGAAARASADLGDHARAARIYESLRAQDPADREVWEPLFDVYKKLGDTARLIALCEETVPLVEEVSDRARLRLEEANILLDAGKSSEAQQILSEILDEDRGQTRAADLLLGILEREGRRDEIVELLTRQIDSAKDRQDTNAIVERSRRLGAMLESENRANDAYDVYVAVLDWDKSSAELLNSVLRLAELRDDTYVVADVIEALLGVERGERVLELASRLVSLRTEQDDEAAVARALELGFVASPTTMELREPLLERYATSGDWPGAARVLREAVSAAPGDRELLTRLVDAHQRAGEAEAALEVLEHLPEEVAGEPELMRARAALLSEVGRDEEALGLLETAYATGSDCASELSATLERAMGRAEPPADRTYLLRLVDVLEHSGDAEAGRNRLIEVLKGAPKDVAVLRRLAELEARAERWDAASNAYRKLIPLEEGESLAEVSLFLAEACERAGRFGDARAGLERALAAVPTDTRVREWLKSLYEFVGDNRALARMVLEEAEADQSVTGRLDTLLRAGSLLLMPEGDPNEAVRVLEEARAQSPESAEGVVLLARAYAAVERGEEAMALLSETIAAHRGRRSKELSLVYREVSAIQLAEGFLSEALSSLTRAFEMDMKNARLAMELGQLALDMDESEVAGRAFRAVTMLRPGDDESPDGVTPELKAHAQYQLALMAQRTGDARRAKVLAQKALSENPEHELARQLLGELGV